MILPLHTQTLIITPDCLPLRLPHTCHSNIRTLHKIYIKNFPKETTEKDIRQHFPLCRNINILTRPSGRKKGFATVTFEDYYDAEDAFEEKKYGFSIGDKVVVMDLDGERYEDFGVTELVVTNLSGYMSREEAAAYFPGACSISMPHSCTQRLTYVRYKKLSDAERAIDNMDGELIDGRRITVILNEKMCAYCRVPGHVIKNCAAYKGADKCSYCGITGHQLEKCLIKRQDDLASKGTYGVDIFDPNNEKSKEWYWDERDIGWTRKCRNCGKPGHIAKDCLEVLHKKHYDPWA